MNKKFTVSLLLVSLLAGCGSNTSTSTGVNSSSNAPTSSSSVSSNVSTNTPTSSSSTNTSSNSSTNSSTNSSVISSTISSSTNSSVSSSSSDRVYSSSVDVDEDKYPYIKSIGVDREKQHSAYQILVYSFFDSDGDGYGDLKGVEQKLDYIKDFGSDIIWLSPIMPAESYHAYDVVSFYDIDERIGTIDDYLSLVNEAHKRDMKIVLDMPINHTSINHEWFKGYLNDDERYLEYYQEFNPDVVNGTNSAMGSKATFYIDMDTYKTYYASFGETMPDLNFQSETVVNAIKDVFKYWVELGADGFRFDAVKHIFDPNEIPAGSDSVKMNNDFFKDLGAYLKTINPNLYLLGENFSGQGEVKLYAESFDAEFDFETWHMGLGAVTNNDPWGAQNPRANYDDTVIGCSNELISINKDWIPTFMSGNHDVTRAATYIGDKVRDDDAALKLYASMLMLRSGIPFVYYGDELGMQGANKSGDYFVEDAEIRMPMNFEDSTIDLETMFYSKVPVRDDSGNLTGEYNNLGANVLKDWPTYKEDAPTTKEAINDENSLYNTYKELIELRKAHPAIYKGTMSQVTDYNGSATVYKMASEDETLYVALNFHGGASTLKDVCDGSIELIHTVNGASVDGTTIRLEGRGVAVFKATGTMNLTPEFISPEPENNGGGSIVSPDAPTSGYALYVTKANGDTHFVELTPTEEFEGFQQYFGDNVPFEAGDVFILYDCTSKVSWIEDNLNSYSTAGWEVCADGIKCTISGTYDIYAKFKWEADEIYIGPANA